MSCTTKAKTLISVATKVGLTLRQTLSAYLTGMRQMFNSNDKQNEPIDLKTIPHLTDRQPSQPPLINPDRSRSNASSIGPLNEFGRASASKSSSQQPSPVKPLRLRERPVQVVLANLKAAGRPQVFQIDQAFEVLQDDQPTGMALTPALDFKTGETTSGWNLTHIDTGMSMASGFTDLEQAQTLAAQLAHIDWYTPFEELTQTSLTEAKQIIRAYQAQLGTAQGDAKAQAWREQDLTQQFVNDGFGDIGRVIEDLGEQVRLTGPTGSYLMPRALLQPLDKADYQAHKIAQPVPVTSGQLCQICRRPAIQTEAEWYRIQDKLTCDDCASATADQAGYLLPETLEATWKQPRCT